MNIIRSVAIELSSIPAIAYKQKLAAGGAGVKVLRLDQDATAVVTINKRDGSWVPFGKIDETLFPQEAIDEAVELTRGLPYSSRGKIKVTPTEVKEEEEVITEEAEIEQSDMTTSPEYQALVAAYTDKNGRMNYALMNRDFIQFAVKSKAVADLLAANASRDEVVCFIVKSRVSNLVKGKSDLTDREVELLIESLDEIDPRSAFKELKEYLKRLASRHGRTKK